MKTLWSENEILEKQKMKTRWSENENLVIKKWNPSDLKMKTLWWKNENLKIWKMKSLRSEKWKPCDYRKWKPSRNRKWKPCDQKDFEQDLGITRPQKVKGYGKKMKTLWSKNENLKIWKSKRVSDSLMKPSIVISCWDGCICTWKPYDLKMKTLWESEKLVIRKWKPRESENENLVKQKT